MAAGGRRRLGRRRLGDRIPGDRRGGSTSNQEGTQREATADQSRGVVLINTRTTAGEGAGSGLVLDSSGVVLTNYHVVEGSTSVKVTVATTGQTYDARVLGHDQSADVALLHFDDASDLATVDLDDDGDPGGRGRRHRDRQRPGPGLPVGLERHGRRPRPVDRHPVRGDRSRASASPG